MTNKNSFQLLYEYQETFSRLPDEIAGKLIKHIFEYVNGSDPVSNDLAVQMAFEPIKEQLKKKKGSKRKEEISADCKKYFMDFYQDKKGVPFYWTVADATALNQLIAKVRSISSENENEALKTLVCSFIDKSQHADKWVFENLSMRLLNSKFNELVIAMRKLNSKNEKVDVPDDYAALIKKYQQQ